MPFWLTCALAVKSIKIFFGVLGEFSGAHHCWFSGRSPKKIGDLDSKNRFLDAQFI